MRVVPFDALLIELEGILVDTRRARRDALAIALTATGTAAKPVPDETLEPLVDRGTFAEAIRAARPGLDETDVELATLRAERALDDALARVTVLLPGARDAIAAIAVHVRIGVVTRLPRRVAERVLAAAGLEPMIFTVVAAEAGGDPTAPAGYERALARLARLGGTSAPTTATVVALVGSAGAVDGAHAAGLRVVAVGAGVARGSRPEARVAGIVGVTYDALVQLLERSGARPT